MCNKKDNEMPETPSPAEEFEARFAGKKPTVGKRASAASYIAERLPAIERLIEGGFTHHDIVTEMERDGVKISVGSFRTTLARLRKANSEEPSSARRSAPRRGAEGNRTEGRAEEVKAEETPKRGPLLRGEDL